MIDRWEAMLIAAQWAFQDARPGALPGLEVSEFDLGFVLWRVPPAGGRTTGGEATVVVDRRTGELTHWPSHPPERVAERYRERRGQAVVAPLTWDPVAQARHERVRGPFPVRVSHLRLADGRRRSGRSMKGDGSPDLHRLVRDILDAVPAGQRVRGGDRCSEVAVLSDLLHAEDATRSATDQPRLSIDDVRGELLHDAELTTYQLLGMDPLEPGRTVLPCRSCRVLLRQLGVIRQRASRGRS